VTVVQFYIISDRQEWKGRFGVKMTVIRLRALCLRPRYALWGRGAQILARCKTRFDLCSGTESTGQKDIMQKRDD